MKRATRDNITYCDSRRYFNPRPREEGDFLDRYSKIIDNDFNPRPREEGDTKFIIKLYTILNFNPRPREEGDGDPLVTAFYDIISIHALVKRATNKGNGVSRSPKDFNPRPREEGDGLHIWVAKFGGDFNPRPREEGDGIQV